MKKKYIIVLLLLLCFVLCGCNKQVENNKIVLSNNNYSISVNEKINLPLMIDDNLITYIASDENIISIENNSVLGKNLGSSIIYAFNESNELIRAYIINVKDNNSLLNIIGVNHLEIGSSYKYKSTYNSKDLEDLVEWESNDEKVLTIDEKGNAKAIGEGLVTIRAFLKDYSKISCEYTVLVTKKTVDESGISIENGTSTIEVSSLKTIFKPIISNAYSYVIGVNSYFNDYVKTIGTGVIYKQQVILKNGEITEYTKDLNVNDIKTFRYYAITNKHVIIKGNKLKVYCADLDYEFEAKLIKYDSKVDLAVISFETGIYFSTCKFANSDNIERGEFVIAVGHPYGYDYYNCATIGIISYTERYLSDDTDNDGVNDWDAKYIQHDAAINEGNSGGPLINMKGEIVGINTLKISSITIEDMGFAIPSNTVTELIEFLEKGEVPQRPLLGVSALEVKTILTSENLMSQYTIPEGVTYGIFVSEVTKGGAAYNAGVIPGDIIVSLNGVEIYYTYILRAELSRFIIGSGQECKIDVIRNGQRIVLTVIF